MQTFLYIFCLLLLTCLGFAENQPKAKSLMMKEAWSQLGGWDTASDVVGSTSAKKWKRVKPGKGILYNGAEGKSAAVVSRQEYGDIELEIEFMIPHSSNSGIYLMQRYEVQILDSFGKSDGELSYGDCGGIYHRWDDSEPDAKKKGYEGTPPTTNASAAPGAWQKFRILFRAPRFDKQGHKIENARFVRVVHNGVIIHEDVEVTGPTRGGLAGGEVASAPLSIQGDHGPIAFRKLQVRQTTLK